MITTILPPESGVEAGEAIGGIVMARQSSPAVLTADEAEELELSESTIAKGMGTFLGVGMALMNIREHKFYRAQYCTFEQCLQERWDIGIRHGQRLMNGAEIAHNLAGAANSSGFILPASESQVRPLAGLPPDEQRAAWAEAVRTASHGRITGRHVADVVARRKGLQISGVDCPPAGDEGRGSSGPSPGDPRLIAQAKDERRKAQADRVIAETQKLIQLMGAADSAAAADVHVALETFQDYRTHLERLDQLHAARQ